MSHPAAPCHLDRTTATAVTEARTPTAVQRHVMDLLDIDPGHHPLVRLSIADWRRVERVAAAITETVHAGPPDDAAVTPCCGRTPFELPRTDRMTYLAALVTCGAAR